MAANIQVLAKANILETDIDAGYQKDGNGSTLVVYGKADAENPAKVSLADVIKQFGGDFKAEDINSQLPGNGSSVLSDLQLSLREVYLVKQSSDGADKPVDYAVWLELYADKLTENWPIKVSSVSIKIWNTSSQNVLEEMKINQLTKLINSAKGTPSPTLPA